jgi:hypothetical protein
MRLPSCLIPLLVAAALAAQQPFLFADTFAGNDATSSTTYTFDLQNTGTPVYGPIDGVGTLAQFDTVTAVTIDDSGNVFTVEAGSFAAGNDPQAIASVVRKISTLAHNRGSVELVAGHSFGRIDGQGTNAHFSFPTCIVWHAPSDGFYICDMVNSLIRFMDSSYLVTTFAGTGPGGQFLDGRPKAAASFAFPTGLVIDPSENFFITDRGNNVIRRIDGATGFVTTIAGDDVNQNFGFADGIGTHASFDSPWGITQDTSVVAPAQAFYVTDLGNFLIRRISFDGGATYLVETLAGTVGSSAYVDGQGMLAFLSEPRGIVYSQAFNAILFTDAFAVRSLELTSFWINTTAGGVSGMADGVGTAAKFLGAAGIAAGNSTGDFWVVDGLSYLSGSNSNCVIVRLLEPLHERCEPHRHLVSHWLGYVVGFGHRLEQLVQQQIRFPLLQH